MGFSMKSYTPLLTDFYQLTMAYGYWQQQMHEWRANFHLAFRHSPFGGNHALSCGLSSVIEFLSQWKFQEEDLSYLASLKNGRGEQFFPNGFLDYLAGLSFTCDVYAPPEGTILFPHEPMLRIEGPLLQCQLLESPLLNFMNFQTLIATKSARVCHAAQWDPVIEFGLRRAQGPDGGVSASRAAYIGGCIATSNVLAGKLFDIPVRGTHAHSWVMAFPDELSAFQTYAEMMPQDCVLLVDTYQTLEGVKLAIEVGKKLQKTGGHLSAIRLDSGNMVELSNETRKLLDAAGLKKTGIFASNTLDEYVITDLKKRGAKISSWGVGTHLATAYDQPALDGVYKLSALMNEVGDWQYKLKISEQAIKISTPGRHQVRRFFYEERYMMDVIYDLSLGMNDIAQAYLINQPEKIKSLDDVDGFADLLMPIFENGKLVYHEPSIHDIRKGAVETVQHFYKIHGVAESYPVGFEEKLYDLKQKLIKEKRQ
jgi:nicotinate phosphoribosyltransferase